VALPSWRASLLTAGGVVVVALVLTGLLSDADALRAAKILGLALIALSLVPLVGFGGQVSLCQMSFAGIGAIVMAHHGHGGNPAGLLLVALVCGAVGALIALPALRLSGIYLALATGAFAVFLDRWAFSIDSFDAGPWRIRLFERGTLPISPVDLPFVDTTTRPGQLVVTSVAFGAAYLLVVGIRRSSFGQRLLAMKDSPAACATIGIDVTRVKLVVFATSAAMAGVGGALYAATLGSVSPDTFSFFESLPLLLLAVAGGIGSASGALFAGLILGGYPIASGIWPWLVPLNRLLPGTIGITLGRNPNGAVRDLEQRYRVVQEDRVSLLAMLATLATVVVLGLLDVISGWGVAYGVGGALAGWPLVARLRARPRSRRSAPAQLEWAGLDHALSASELGEVDRALDLQGARR
jgi:branched-chain amino acid transport system permease protein